MKSSEIDWRNLVASSLLSACLATRRSILSFDLIGKQHELPRLPLLMERSYATDAALRESSAIRVQSYTHPFNHLALDIGIQVDAASIISGSSDQHPAAGLPDRSRSESREQCANGCLL